MRKTKYDYSVIIPVVLFEFVMCNSPPSLCPCSSSSSVSWLHNELRVAMVGHNVDLSYSYDHLGEETSVLKELANGTHPFCQVMDSLRGYLEGTLVLIL